MAYSISPSSDGCYEGTTCLINKLGIKDEKKLSEIEAQITFAKTAMLEANPIEGSFDFEHFKKIHFFLFCDLYDWAGVLRSVDLSKKKTRFLEASQIERVGTLCFSKVSNGFFEGLSFDEFSKRIAVFYHDVNYIHPFREGNGRVQRIFFAQLIRHYGYDIHFSELDTDELMFATILAAQGVSDVLQNFFKEAIKKRC